MIIQLYYHRQLAADLADTRCRLADHVKPSISKHIILFLVLVMTIYEHCNGVLSDCCSMGFHHQKEWCGAFLVLLEILGSSSARKERCWYCTLLVNITASRLLHFSFSHIRAYHSP